jgi:7-cyano-7-deazaguanine synthase
VAAVQQGIAVNGVVRTQENARSIEALGAQAFVSPNYDARELAEACQGAQGVIHLVAIGIGSEEELRKVNVGITERAIKAASAAGVQRFVYLSGLGVGRDDVETRTLNTYFNTKLLAENLIKNSGVPYAIFQPSFIIGPGTGNMPGDDMTPKIMHEVTNGRVRFPSTEGSALQPIFIGDAVQAILGAATGAGPDNRTYELVGPENITPADFVGKVYDAIVAMDVHIAQPLIEPMPPERMLADGDESLDFLGYTVTGDPQIVTETFHLPSTPADEAIQAAVRGLLRPDEIIPENRVILLLSGGLDSVTSLYWAIAEGYDIIPLTMLYKNRPLRELRAVREIARRNNLKLIEVPVPYIEEVFELKLDGYPVPSLFGANEAYVPYRNLVFNAIAAYYADIYGARYIISGHILSDPLPDANMGFFNAFETLVENIHVGEKSVSPKILLPMKGKSKTEVAQMAIDLGVPVEWTWSCEFDDPKPCGQCRPCRERLGAFNELGLQDPVVAFELPAEDDENA